MFLLLLQKDLLRFFINDVSSKTWQDTATNWLITAIVVAALGAGLTFGYKAFRKSTAGLSREKVWRRGETWRLIIIGIFPIFLILLGIWWLTRDFFNFVQAGGLFKGVVFAWLLYLIFMFVGHLVSPWRREII